MGRANRGLARLADRQAGPRGRRFALPPPTGRAPDRPHRSPGNFFSSACGDSSSLAQPWCREGRRRGSPPATPVPDSPRTLPWAHGLHQPRPRGAGRRPGIGDCHRKARSVGGSSAPCHFSSAESWEFPRNARAEGRTHPLAPRIPHGSDVFTTVPHILVPTTPSYTAPLALAGRASLWLCRIRLLSERPIVAKTTKCLDGDSMPGWHGRAV